MGFEPPSRAALIDVLEGLRSALFPGYFGLVQMTEGLSFHIGAILEEKLRHPIVTLGAAGSLWAHRDESGAAALHRQPALPVTAVDAVGAGDCFCGVFAAALAAGAAVPDALHRATAAAALAVQRPGAQPSMPAADQIEQAQRTLPPGTTVTAS